MRTETVRCPGLLLSLGVTLGAYLLERGEILLFGRAWLETLVLAILAGSLVRTAGWVPQLAEGGIRFAASFLLEFAVVLLGASVSAAALAGQGLPLLAGIAATVLLAIAAGYLIGRLLRLPHELALLVACGNAICGNSAIAALAPAIDADARDVTAAIAFTAVLGVVVVLLLPLSQRWLGFNPAQYGVFAGMTVYAVPQVLAATAPVSALSLQVGTLVKLVRVLMLGPVVAAAALARGVRTPGATAAPLLPWFIMGFLAMMGARSLGLLPAALLQATHTAASALTCVSMAALGLGVNAKTVLGAGPRVSAAVVISLGVLCLLNLGLVCLLATP